MPYLNLVTSKTINALSEGIYFSSILRN